MWWSIGENAARIAIVEFGPTVKLHLPIEKGTTKPNVLYGIEFIGEQTFAQKIPISREDAVNQTRQLIFPPNSMDRVQVPKLVLLVSVATIQEISESKLDNITINMDFGRRFGEYGAHISYLDTYAGSFDPKVNDSWNLKYRVSVNSQYQTQYYDTYLETVNGPRPGPPNLDLPDKVARTTKHCLESCSYIKDVGDKCFFDQRGACVADVTYYQGPGLPYRFQLLPTALDALTALTP